MPLLSCQKLTLGYEGKEIVSGLSFDVSAGDYLCIVGENGSGKSTLMRTMLALQAPVAGRIVMGDGLSPREIGYMPQQTAVQKDFPATVREVVRSGCMNRCGLRPFYNEAEKRIADQNMEKLGVARLAKRCYRDLSGGQQQRVLLARALCAARALLLLDEPAAGLDIGASAGMYDLIRQLNGGGMTIVMISHDIDASVKNATHILRMGGASTLFFGSAASFIEKGGGLLGGDVLDHR
ncbi:MAG: ATP-binding cassette domain-containing protein [Oscillospiraceae bacterium]|nr:ATP-binding cassette domain-containing protein [Oscillospiraceae bacterium]